VSAAAKNDQNYHRLLNRAVWSSREVSRILLQLLLDAFVAPDAAVVLGLDETVERRWGAKIAARGIYRDAVRSSKEFFVKTSGLRWLSLMLLAPMPWLGRVWALPFLTVLAPSERYHEQRHERHKKLTDWARQLILQVRRWLPGRKLVVVADSGYAVLELLAACAGLPHDRAGRIDEQVSLTAVDQFGFVEATCAQHSPLGAKRTAEIQTPEKVLEVRVGS